MKGYIYTMEMLIAVSLIFISLVYINSYTPTKPEMELSLIKAQGFEAMEYVDGKGSLRTLVSNANETGVEEQLRAVISNNLNFETEICINDCTKTNVPDNETVVGIDYYISAHKSNYFGKKVRLWLWRKF
ncbi:MAG: hypothetical protein V1900_03205 [Candidatus Aenigmatarchaeota archaeon]